MIKLLIFFSVSLFLSVETSAQKIKYAVIVSANMEWKAVKKFYPKENFEKSPWGEFFFKQIENQQILFFHEGWGKVAAAGATQYVIDHYKPEVLINLGTCGGFEGAIGRDEIVLANRTIIYDIKEAMGDSKEAIDDYTTGIDLSWLGTEYPARVIKTTLVSADQDLRPEEIERLKSTYKAVAGDWESGSIAYTAQRNQVRLVILRGVTDLVNTKQGEAYGDFEFFTKRAELVMFKLLEQLPDWIGLMKTRKIK